MAAGTLKLPKPMDDRIAPATPLQSTNPHPNLAQADGAKARVPFKLSSSRQPTLDQIMKVELLDGLDVPEITKLWLEYHRTCHPKGEVINHVANCLSILPVAASSGCLQLLAGSNFCFGFFSWVKTCCRMVSLINIAPSASPRQHTVSAVIPASTWKQMRTRTQVVVKSR